MAKAKCRNCEVKCAKGKMNPETLQALEAGVKNLIGSNSTSLLKKYLTEPLFERLKCKTTPFGSSLWDSIKSGVENLDSGCGIYAADPESYTVFEELFDPIIQDYHIGFKKSDKHPKKNWGALSDIENLDPDGTFVVSTRVRCGRNLANFPFVPKLTENQYKDIEEKMKSALAGLTGDLKGQYYPLVGMSADVQQQLINDHFLFKEGDRFLQSANACRFWPIGRGIFHNAAKTFLVWVNEEDQVRIISMEAGGNLGAVYERLVRAANEIERKVKFVRSPRLGYLTFCPTNLGTTIRASVHIKIPKLSADKDRLDALAAQYNLQVRGTAGEHSEVQDGIYDISNKRRLGLTEYDAVKEMYDGVLEIIKAESSL